MPEDNAITALLVRYESQPVLRGLVQLVPHGIGAAVETAILTKFNSYRAERLREFFDELGSGTLSLTPELIESEDFLHCYFATLNAVLKSRRRQKARYLARLLKGGFSGGVEGVDEYEELLSVIDDLSHRELALLSLLAKHENATPSQEGENELQRANRFWPNLVRDAREQLRIPEDLLQSILVRLQRSGCYEEFTGTYFDYTGGRGKLTQLYCRLERAAGRIAEVVS